MLILTVSDNILICAMFSEPCKHLIEMMSNLDGYLEHILCLNSAGTAFTCYRSCFPFLTSSLP